MKTIIYNIIWYLLCCLIAYLILKDEVKSNYYFFIGSLWMLIMNNGFIRK